MRKKCRKFAYQLTLASTPYSHNFVMNCLDSLNSEGECKLICKIFLYIRVKGILHFVLHLPSLLEGDSFSKLIDGGSSGSSFVKLSHTYALKRLLRFRFHWFHLCNPLWKTMEDKLQTFSYAYASKDFYILSSIYFHIVG